MVHVRHNLSVQGPGPTKIGSIQTEWSKDQAARRSLMQVSKSTLTRNSFFIFSLFDSSRIHFPPTQIFLCFHQNYEKKLLKKCLIFEKCRFQVDRFMFIISEINDWRTKRTKTIPNWLKGIHFSFIKPTEEIKIEL